MERKAGKRKQKGAEGERACEGEAGQTFCEVVSVLTP